MDNNERIIEEVRKYDCLYNLQSGSYKNFQYKEDLWCKIGKDVGVPAEAVLKCWRCSTDVSNGEFCNDPFNSDSISDQQHYWSYVNCTYSVGVKSVNARPVCKKLVQEVYGKRVITRSCFYEDVDDPTDKCAHDATSSNIQTIFCQTCSSDGCNGVSGIVPYAMLIFLSFSTTKFFK